jgi:hypothetical protein
MLKDDKKPPVGFSITISLGARVQITFIFNLREDALWEENFCEARHDLSCAKTDINYIQREKGEKDRDRRVSSCKLSGSNPCSFLIKH